MALVRREPLIPAEAVLEEIALAELELMCGRASVAREQLANVEVGEIVRVEDRPGAAEALRVFAACLASAGADEDAAFLLGTLRQLEQECGIAAPAHVARRTEALVFELRRRLGDERFARITGDGAQAPAMELLAELPARLARA